MFKSYSGRDFSTNTYCSLKNNQHGPFLLVIAIKGQTRAVIIIPEYHFNEGWGNLASMVEEFTCRKINSAGILITTGCKPIN